MAEGVDNDMNQQQQQDVPHGQEAFHTPSVHFQSTPLDDINTPSLLVTASSTQLGANPGPKKKSAFQITSVTETRAHSRGDSNGYDIEDLNESDVTEIQVETREHSGNGNGGSRFKVVKIQRNEPYRRGRWLCHDFEQPPTSSTSTQSNADTREGPWSASTASSSGIFNSNHVSAETSASNDPSLQDHRNAVEVTFNYLPGQTPSIAPAIVNFEATLRKKESDPHLSSATTNQDFSDLGSSASSKTLPVNERIETLPEIARHAVGNAQSESTSTIEELPIVNTIATAMDQITQIKSALLTVVHEEVQTLKDTITKLKEENQDLKQENEKLKQLIDTTQTT
ncbi:uncharacterized protein LOC116301646 [Actinia tenebrosa]|uniref:Uncharacterized protein LOC116301646 n=1 Tax=Actinia tenebrosa TaxID=6105 RepID=A0A6P8IJF2_ACTTE|nr:uncharacterized protein LOC116301646 [Actinia tenebrosa]